MKKNNNNQKSILAGWEEVDNSLRAIAQLKSEQQHYESIMNAALLEIQDKYQDKLNGLKNLILLNEHNIELYCAENRNEFEKKKTKELNYGAVGFRYGNPRLAQLKGFTWESIKQFIKQSKKFNKFIRVKEDIDKEAIKIAGLSPNELKSIGCAIVQDESFFYEANYKEAQNVREIPKEAV